MTKCWWHAKMCVSVCVSVCVCVYVCVYELSDVCQKVSTSASTLTPYQFVDRMSRTRLSMTKCRWQARMCGEKSPPLPPLLHPINKLIGCVKLVSQWQSVDDRRDVWRKVSTSASTLTPYQCVSYQQVDRVCQTRLSTTKCRRHTMVCGAKSPPLPPFLHPINKLIGCVQLVSRWHSVDDTCRCVKKSLHLCLHCYTLSTSW